MAVLLVDVPLAIMKDVPLPTLLHNPPIVEFVLLAVMERRTAILNRYVPCQYCVVREKTDPSPNVTFAETFELMVKLISDGDGRILPLP